MSLLLVLVAVGGAAAEGIRVGSEAEVIADDGANLREGPSAAAGIVALVGQARYVFVEAGPEGGWYKVEYDGDVGWVHASLLGPARPRTTSRGDAVGRGSDERPPSGAPAGVMVGAEAQVATADGVNLRREPSTAAVVVELVKNARIVYVLDGPKRTDEGLWYRVEFDGSVGWVMGSYLGRRGQGAAESEAPAATGRPGSAQAELAPAKTEAAPAGSAPAPARAGSASPPARSRGEAIAQRALGLVGLPYAWGGSSPRTGFDCSGLIAYVLGQFGVFPGRTADAQAGAGMSVTGGDLLPGDIIVFANTYARGYSHTGIYVGGGRFVHAEDYGTGVVVSPVFGGYWGRHYAGARRAW
ncbi:MAG TPA: NlpC/P60 family protein [Chloroflexota bacterium]|nr:NlpC/P60 family protein [Chloroflexota bacterium]